MTDVAEKPLVTFALFAYNQERYIREAVEAALAQDYPNMEIILSDDASLDGTFKIMEKLAKNYNGPHRIILNRNNSNLGVGGHVNKLARIASGEIIVCGAGDDISISSRVSKIVDRWLAGDRGVPSIYSSVLLINEESEVVGIRSDQADCTPVALVKNGYGPLGASHAFDRKLMTDLGPISESVVCEDQVIGFRAAMGGGISFISEPLVKYRVHTESLTSGLMGHAKLSPSSYRSIFLGGAKRRLDFHLQNLRDCQSLGVTDGPIVDCILAEIVADEFDVVALSGQNSIVQLVTSSFLHFSRGAKFKRIAKSCVKVIFWPIYARYYDWMRRRAIIVAPNLEAKG